MIKRNNKNKLKRYFKYCLSIILSIFLIRLSFLTPLVFIGIMSLTVFLATFTKRLKIKYALFLGCLLLFLTGYFFWCPKSRPLYNFGYCYSCHETKDLIIQPNQIEEYKMFCPNRFVNKESCCGITYKSSLNKNETNDVFSTVLCRCSGGGYDKEFGLILYSFFYLFIWTLILKLLGFLDKRKSK